ncbi:unnamed protein product [Schistosoma turkestanicum]|nr:unnamed protein product [Schistosoma turkestanicum]
MEISIIEVVIFSMPISRPRYNQATMKLFSLQILYKTDTSAKLLQASHELSSFGYFQRSSVREVMDFAAKLVCERTARCQRGLVKEQDYICHVYVRHDNLCGVLICDQEYPQRVAQTLLTKSKRYQNILVVQHYTTDIS